VGACGSNGRARRFSLVAAQIVEHDNVALGEGGDQDRAGGRDSWADSRHSTKTLTAGPARSAIPSALRGHAFW
jgi:hypothetical protein